jgi:hypothetical protein
MIERKQANQKATIDHDAGDSRASATASAVLVTVSVSTLFGLGTASGSCLHVNELF